MSETTFAGNERRDLLNRDTFNSSSGSSFTTGDNGDGGGGGGGGLSTSDKIAIGVGVPGAFGTIAGAYYAWWQYKRRRRGQREHSQAQQPAPRFIVPTPAMAEMD